MQNVFSNIKFTEVIYKEIKQKQNQNQQTPSTYCFPITQTVYIYVFVRLSFTFGGICFKNGHFQYFILLFYGYAH